MYSSVFKTNDTTEDEKMEQLKYIIGKQILEANIIKA